MLLFATFMVCDFHQNFLFPLLGPPLFLSVTRACLHFVNREQSMVASGLYDGPLFTPAVTVVWWPSCICACARTLLGEETTAERYYLLEHSNSQHVMLCIYISGYSTFDKMYVK